MKLLTGTTLALILAIGMASPGLARTSLPEATRITGTVESIDGSKVRIRTTSGAVRTYKVDPEVISFFKLRPGSNVFVDGTELRTGQVAGVDVQTINVDVDNGGRETFLTLLACPGSVMINDLVVISPDGSVTRADKFVLTASNFGVVYEPRETMPPRPAPAVRRRPRPIDPTPEPPFIPDPPVPGLW